MRIYISGKITGLPLHEAMAMFQSAEEFLQKKQKMSGLPETVECVNPFEQDHGIAEEMARFPETFSMHEVWAKYMEVDLGALLNCDAVYMLKNWGGSKGARIEHAIAKELGLTVEYEQ